MAVDIGRSLQEGIARTASRNGLLLVALWTVVGAASLVLYNSWFAALYADLPADPLVIGPTLDLRAGAAGLGTLVLYLVSMVLVAGALRTFVSDERRELPARHFTRNLGWTLANLVVGFVLFYLATTIGFFLLFLPGLFLLVSLYFWFVLVVVEDQTFYDAFRNSWALARGNRWTLLGIGLLVTVAGWVLMAVPMAVTFLLSPWTGLVVYGVVVALYGVFAIATTARVYVQLSGSTA